MKGVNFEKMLDLCLLCGFANIVLIVSLQCGELHSVHILYIVAFNSFSLMLCVDPY